jgi:peptide-methionine (S)-S-oxide reductase
MWFIESDKQRLPDPSEALPGRPDPIVSPGVHTVLGTPIAGPWPEGTQTAVFGLGCFWGAEKAFWELPGVVSTAVGYAGGITPNPTYREVCTGKTGHAEVVQVAFDPAKINYAELLKVFFEAHDPTQGMRQQNDIGTQYRSAIYATPEQRPIAEAVLADYDRTLQKRGMDQITTEIADVPEYFLAEDYHQQYLHKVPNGYCGLKGTGVSCAVPTLANRS